MSIFRKKKADFYDLLSQQSRKVEEGMQAFVEFMRIPSQQTGARVYRLEEEADTIRALVVNELNQAFVTPIDREDIYDLSRAVDDIIDYAKTTVEEMDTFQVGPNSQFSRMAEGLGEAATAIRQAIESLPRNREKAMEYVVFAKKRENYVEHCYREALQDLFKSDDVVGILKRREIYRHLSNAADRVDEAANIIGNILVKSM